MYRYKTLSELVEHLDKHFVQDDHYTFIYNLETDDIIHFVIKHDDEIVLDKKCDIYQVSIPTWKLDTEIRKWFTDQWYDYKRDDLYPETIVGGDITLGEKVIVTDPCYDVDTWCNGILDNVKPGKWHTEAKSINKNNNGNHCTELIIWHSDYEKPTEFEHTDIDVGVDSGQAGIADYDYFAKIKSNKDSEEEWYESIKTYERARVPLMPLQKQVLPKYKALYKEYLKQFLGPIEEYNKDLYTEIANLEHEHWFDSKTLDDDKFSSYLPQTWTDEHSVFTSTGYGDGSYDCFIAKDNNKIIGIKIDYFYYEDEDDEDE